MSANPRQDSKDLIVLINHGRVASNVRKLREENQELKRRIKLLEDEAKVLKAKEACKQPKSPVASSNVPPQDPVHAKTEQREKSRGEDGAKCNAQQGNSSTRAILSRLEKKKRPRAYLVEEEQVEKRRKPRDSKNREAGKQEGAAETNRRPSQDVSVATSHKKHVPLLLRIRPTATPKSNVSGSPERKEKPTSSMLHPPKRSLDEMSETDEGQSSPGLNKKRDEDRGGKGKPRKSPRTRVATPRAASFFIYPMYEKMTRCEQPRVLDLTDNATGREEERTSHSLSRANEGTTHRRGTRIGGKFSYWDNMQVL